MIEIQLLRMMRVRSDYNRLVGSVNLDALEDKTRQVVLGIGRYFKKFVSHKQIDFQTFLPYFEHNLHSKLSAEDRQVFRNVIKNMARSYPDEATRQGILESVHELNIVHKVQNSVQRYANGDDIDIVQEMTAALDHYKKIVGATAIDEVDENIDDLLDNMHDENGIKWRIAAINRYMRPMLGGDFGIMAARPDQGKTSIVASEVTFMAPQLDVLWPDEDRCVLWLNNEGPGHKIRMRTIQAALNAREDDLHKWKDQGTLYSKYWEAIGGKNRIRIVDVHGKHVGQIEAMIEAMKPGIVVYDMLDNIRGFGDAARTDLQLEKMYQWGRDMAVKHDMIGIATSQISAEGANHKQPGQSMLKDSKTGKQGACDFILMMGSLEEKPEYASSRWLSLPKNKLRKPRSPGTFLECVTFDRDRSRFKSVENTE